MTDKKVFWVVFGLVLGIIVYVVVTATLLSPKHPLVKNPVTATPPEQIFCTQDVKLCPDGSYVPRQPPSCDFSPCPGVAK